MQVDIIYPKISNHRIKNKLYPVLRLSVTALDPE